MKIFSFTIDLRYIGSFQKGKKKFLILSTLLTTVLCRGVSSTRLLLDYSSTRRSFACLVLEFSCRASSCWYSILDCYYSSRSTSNKIPVTYEFLAMFRQFFEILGYFPPNFQIFGLFFTKISILGFVFSHFCL